MSFIEFMLLSSDDAATAVAGYSAAKGTRKLCCRNDDRAMRHKHGYSENFGTP